MGIISFPPSNHCLILLKTITFETGVNISLGTNYWRNRVLKVAKDFKDKLNFAIASKSEFSREMESFGDREKDEDVLVAVKNYAGSKFMMTEKFR